MEHLGPLIWAVVIILAMISSVIKAARGPRSGNAAAGARRAARPTQVWQITAAPGAAQPAPPSTAASVREAPRPAAVPVRVVPQMPAAGPPTPAAAGLVTPLDEPKRKRFPLRLTEPGQWVRGVITAEVLGPPVGIRADRW